MANKELFSRIQLKYDSYSAWTTAPGKDLVLKAGEMGICAIPSGSTAVNGDNTRPQILFKVGDGTSTFEALPWASAKAADVYDWAKKSEADFTTWVKGLIDVGDINLAGYATEKYADQAEADAVATAKEYADGLITALNIGQYATTTYADQAEADAIAAAKEYADGLADNYATAAQGALADSAVQSVSIATGSANGKVKLTVDGQDTEASVAGLKSAAYTESSAYATAAQGELADSALQKADITSGSANGTIAVEGTDVAVTGLGDAAYTTVSALNATAKGYADDAQAAAATDAQTKATKALDDAKSYTDGEIDKIEASIEDVIDGTTPVAKATDADKLGGVVAADYATKAYADQAEADALSEAKKYTDEVKKAILTGDSTTELKDAYDTLVEIQTWIEGAGVNATELTEAIAAEAKTRGEEDTKLQNQINALGITDGKVASAAVADVANSLADTAKAEVKAVKVDNAGHADTATKATQDGSGNVIADTYQTIAQAEEDFETLEDYVDTAKSDVIGASGNASTADTIYGAKKYAEEKASAAQTAAINAAATDAATKAGTAESNAKSYADGLIEALDVTDTAVAGKYVSAVSEENGKITVTRADLPVDTLVTGTTNGTVKFNGTDVAVKGLGSAAYTDANAYATAEQGKKADYGISTINVGAGLKATTNASYKDHSTVSNVPYSAYGVAGVVLTTTLPSSIDYRYDAITVIINGKTYNDVRFNVESNNGIRVNITDQSNGSTGTATVKFRSVDHRTQRIELDNDETNYFVINCGSATTVI